MEEHPIESLMRTTMDSLKDMIDVNTIVGEAVNASDGSTIIPISKVSIGFASGGAEFEKTHEDNSQDGGGGGDYPFGGGSGAGLSLQPVAFLVVKQDTIKLLPLNQDTSLERIISNVPDYIKEFKKIFSKNESEECQCNCSDTTES
jgi:sporulation protein YtfJ